MTTAPAPAQSHPTELRAEQVRELLLGPGELTIVDVREYEVVRTGHLYHAAYLPASEVEGRRERVRANVPRLDTLVVLVGDDADVTREAETWREWGYTRVHVLAGGVDAWSAAGGQLFSHVCVPSKALAETARELLGTPTTHVDDLARSLGSENPPLVLDVRTEQEYKTSSIPGAIGLPGGELVAALAGPLGVGRRVVVTCAFRTRGLFGAQSLYETGLVDVAFLEGGTSAWEASGRPLQPGGSFSALPDPGVRADPEQLAATLQEAAGVGRVNQAGLRRLVADDTRTTYVIDPRLSPVAAIGAIPVRPVAGGQLVQAVDDFLPVLRARVVLVDDPPFLRALAAARWLTAYRQLEVYVLDEQLGTSAPHPAPVGAVAPVAPPEPGESATTLDSTAWSQALPGFAQSEPAGGFAL